MKRSIFALALLLAVAPAAPAQDFGTWLNQRILESAAMATAQRDPAKQAEPPAAQEGGTTLVDRGKATDLVGVGLGLARLAAGDKDAPSSGAATVSAYALYTALANLDPGSPVIYARHAGLRRVSATLAYADSTQATETERARGRTTSAGLKWTVIDKRDPSTSDTSSVNEALANATTTYARIAPAVVDLFLRSHQRRMGTAALTRAAYEARLDAAPAAEWEALDASERAAIEGFIARDAAPFLVLDQSIQKFLQKLRRAPQLALTYLASTEVGKGTTHTMEGVFDFALGDRLVLTLNAGWTGQVPIEGGTTHGGRVAGQLQLQVSPEHWLSLVRPATLDLAAEGKWADGERSTAKGQLKLTVPLKKGIDLPLSLTVANRTELIDERDVRGQIGFTVDLARLLSSVQP